MPTPEPSPLEALQSALEARIDADVTTTLGPLAALRDALVAYETAIRDQLARDAFAAIPEIATAIPAPDVPAAGLAVLTALRAAARAYQAPPAALARTALETALVVVGGGREGGYCWGGGSATRALRPSRYAIPPRPVYARQMPETPARSKYLSYKFAFDRMRAAHAAGFTIESATLAESVIADRILSFLLARGETLKAAERTPFDTLLKKLAPHLTGGEKFTMAELVRFKDERNAAVHAVAKSVPGQAPMKVDDFVAVAARASDLGQTLARQVADWVKREKRARVSTDR